MNHPLGFGFIDSRYGLGQGSFCLFDILGLHSQSYPFNDGFQRGSDVYVPRPLFLILPLPLECRLVSSQLIASVVGMDFSQCAAVLAGVMRSTIVIILTHACQGLSP